MRVCKWGVCFIWRLCGSELCGDIFVIAIVCCPLSDLFLWVREQLCFRMGVHGGFADMGSGTRVRWFHLDLASTRTCTCNVTQEVYSLTFALTHTCTYTHAILLHTHLCAHLYLHSLILVPVLTLSHLYLHLQLHLGLYTLIFAFTSEASCTLKLAFALSPRLNIIKQYKHILWYQGEGVPESTGTVGVVSCLNFFFYL